MRCFMVAPFENLTVLENSGQDRHRLRRLTKRRAELRRRRQPTQTASGAMVRSSLSIRGDGRKESRLSSREDFETFFEAIGLESFFSFLVVVRVVCVEP